MINAISMQIFVILFMIIEVIFGLFIIYAGKDLRSIQSATNALAEFNTGKKQTKIRSYFLLWSSSFGQGITNYMIKSFGDSFTSRYYRFSGTFFLIASPVFFLAPLFQIQLLIA